MKKIIATLLLIVLLLSLFPMISIAEETEVAPAAIDLTEILVTVVRIVTSFILTLLAAVLVPPAKRWLAAKTTAEQRTMFNTLVRQLVKAAEQTLGAKCGPEKLDYVEKELRNRGYVVDYEAIEAAVKDMNDLIMDEIVDEITDTTDYTDPEPGGEDHEPEYEEPYSE